MSPRDCLPGPETLLPVVAALSLLLSGAGVVGGAGIGSSTDIDEMRSLEGHTSSFESSAQSTGHSMVILTGAVTLRGGTRSLAGSNASNTNVFSPISQPSVVFLVTSGLLALCLLTLMGLRERFSTTASTDDEQAPWKPVTDAERVEQMLVANDGYMKQSRIVEQTDWSKAKVSRLLSRMASQGIVRKDKDGRENIIILTRQ